MIVLMPSEKISQTGACQIRLYLQKRPKEKGSTKLCFELNLLPT